jgi:hypothetical protein
LHRRVVQAVYGGAVGAESGARSVDRDLNACVSELILHADDQLALLQQ